MELLGQSGHASASRQRRRPRCSVSGLVAVAGALHALSDETSSYHDFAVSLVGRHRGPRGRAPWMLSSQAWHELEPWLLRAADSAGVQLLEAVRLLAVGAEASAHAVERASHLLGHGALDWLGIEGEHHSGSKRQVPNVRHPGRQHRLRGHRCSRTHGRRAAAGEASTSTAWRSAVSSNQDPIESLAW